MDLRRGESEIRGVAEKMERVGLPSEILDDGDGESPPMGRIRFVTLGFCFDLACSCSVKTVWI